MCACYYDVHVNSDGKIQILLDYSSTGTVYGLHYDVGWIFTDHNGLFTEGELPLGCACCCGDGISDYYSIRYGLAVLEIAEPG